MAFMVLSGQNTHTTVFSYSYISIVNYNNVIPFPWIPTDSWYLYMHASVPLNLVATCLIVIYLPYCFCCYRYQVLTVTHWNLNINNRSRYHIFKTVEDAT